MFRNLLKEKLYRGEAALGIFHGCASSDLVEVSALAGYDFVVIDCEHGPMSPETAQDMIRAAESRGITPLVRVPEISQSTMLRYLDIGAHGLEVPDVDTADDARAMVRYAKYAPEGERGVAFPRSADYGLCDVAAYTKQENEQTLLIAHCENTESLGNLEAICQVPGIDVIMLGPFDMSQSLGVTGQVTHPLVEQAAQQVLAICRKYGRIPGIFCGSGEMARRRYEQGFRFLGVGCDTVMYAQKCRAELAAFGK